MSIKGRLLELIQNPETGRLSTSDVAIFIALFVSSFVLVWVTICGRLEEWLFIGYLTAWVVQSQGSKQAAIQRVKSRLGDITAEKANDE